MKEFVEKLIGRLEEEREISYADFYEYLMKYELYNDFDEDDDWFYKGLIRAISIVNKLAEEYNNEDCSKCSRRSWYQKGYKDAEKKFAEEMGVSKIENTTTNADRIRSMSDEELADYIFGVSVGNAPCVLCTEECDFCELTDEECKSKTLAWLQSEVKGSE